MIRKAPGYCSWVCCIFLSWFFQPRLEPELFSTYTTSPPAICSDCFLLNPIFLNLFLTALWRLHPFFWHFEKVYVFTRVSGWKLVTILSKLVYFTYLADVSNLQKYRGERTSIYIQYQQDIPVHGVNPLPCSANAIFSSRSVFCHSCR